MSRPPLIENDELLARLSRVFRDAGYEGTSLSALSEATGLKRASLYHRFPEGKEQMASEILVRARTWLDDNVLEPLHSDAPPEKRLRIVASRLGDFYERGERACLLNMLSSPIGTAGPFATSIRETFEALVDALAKAARDAGVPARQARTRAVRVVSLIQGGLVVSRGLGRTEPFAAALAALEVELLG